MSNEKCSKVERKLGRVIIVLEVSSLTPELNWSCFTVELGSTSFKRFKKASWSRILNLLQIVY